MGAEDDVYQGTRNRIEDVMRPQSPVGADGNGNRTVRVHHITRPLGVHRDRISYAMTLRNSSQRLRAALIPPLWARVAPATHGGVECIAYLLAAGLVSQGHQVTVV